VDGNDGLATLSTARAIRTASSEHRVVSPGYREVMSV